MTMKQIFDDADRTKKMSRVPIKNPTTETPAGVAEAIKTSLSDGYLPCEAAFEISKNLRVPPVTVGDAADDLGIRVTDCQLGCFKVQKASHDTGKAIRPDIAKAVETEVTISPLTCAVVFALARRFKVAPIEIADAANATHTKIHRCQLGCF